MELESKAFGIEPQGQEVKKAFEDFLGNFEAFKQNNDERLKGIEKRSADVLLDEKVDRINKALESQQRTIDHVLGKASPIRSIAPGQPDDAASDVGLSEAIALLAGNLGAARLNALQLEHLQAVMASPEP